MLCGCSTGCSSGIPTDLWPYHFSSNSQDPASLLGSSCSNRHCPSSTTALHRATCDMAKADNASVEGAVKAPKKFSSIAGNWKMRDGQHPEEFFFVHRHFSANSSLAGPSKSFLGLLAGASYYFFVSDDLQVAKSRFGRVITPRTWPVDGTEQVNFAGTPLGFGPTHLHCSHVDSQCLIFECRQDTEIMEIKFQLGKKSTAAQLQATLVGSERIVFDAQFVRVKALPSNVGSQAHSSARRLAGPVPSEPGLESASEAESSEDESMDN
ncbi:unnamed protein product [Polarella glacialis]|uniref:Uncharacterized protein n=1 Tax=Polarella glacialis TaxID=89957 RepID=A0A813IW03_POLGL|nr:unnamed protein product [Polarella glacialis]